MFNHRISPLFSIAVVGLSLAFAGGGTYALLDSLPKPPHKEEIKPEPKVITIPTVEINTTPEPVVVNEVRVEVPKAKRPTITHPKPQAAQRVAEAPTPAQPCDLVCEDEWHDSLLFAQGGRYKNCKCK